LGVFVQALIRFILFDLKNLVLRAKSQQTGFARTSPKRNPGVRSQNKVFAFGSIKEFLICWSEATSEFFYLLTPEF